MNNLLIIILIVIVLFNWNRSLQKLILNFQELRIVSLGPVVQTVDNAIHRINHYPLDIAIGFAITYPVDSDLSGG